MLQEKAKLVETYWEWNFIVFDCAANSKIRRTLRISIEEKWLLSFRVFAKESYTNTPT